MSGVTGVIREGEWERMRLMMDWGIWKKGLMGRKESLLWS
jgi:hypothetical protein